MIQRGKAGRAQCAMKRDNRIESVQNRGDGERTRDGVVA